VFLIKFRFTEIESCLTLLPLAGPTLLLYYEETAPILYSVEDIRKKKSSMKVRPFLTPERLLRLMILYLAWVFFSLALGFAFFLINTSVAHFVFWFAPYYKPAERIFSWAAGISEPEDGLFHQHFSGWRIFAISVRAVLLSLIFVLGLQILVREGFLGQNLIYLILSSP
jgi:hypothetical protein